jgi:thiamine transport system ATP-binding protein
VVELREIIKQAGLTAIYVTHDQKEAFAVADRIAVMNAGQIEQIGTPEALYRQPETVFTAQFLGLNNILPVMRREGGRYETALGMFEIADEPDAILLHPDGLNLAPGAAHGIWGVGEESVFQGDRYRVRMRHSSDTVLGFKVQERVGVGDMISVVFAPEAVIPLKKR